MRITTLLIFSLLILIPFSLAKDRQLYTTQYLILETDISSTIEVNPTSDDYKIEYIKADLSFIPIRDSRQEILSLISKPKATGKDGILEYRWDNPSAGEYPFSLKAEAKTRYDLVEVTKKIPFPLTGIPVEYLKYTKRTFSIDSDNEEIITLASGLVEGEDDLYNVVFKIALWVRDNINYTLDSLTASVSQKASWVLENREGVCDELTSLFVAMLRSLGIPAKYISGVAYTNWNNINDFSPHGWAEVYFPRFGWIPFDVTYNELGFIDATHLKLRESLDTLESSTSYEWRSKNINVQTRELDIRTRVKEGIGKIKPLVEIKANVWEKETNFGSYNVIDAQITNRNDFYVITDLYLSKPPEISLIGKNKKTVLLKPSSEKKLYWLIKVADDLSREFVYTFPIEVLSSRNASSKTSFDASYGNPSFTLEELTSAIKQLEEQKAKVYSRKVKLKCTPQKEEFYVYEDNYVECLIKNTGNIILTDLAVCLKEDCKNFDLGISQEKYLNFSLDTLTIGERDVMITATNKDVSNSQSIAITKLDRPRLEIMNLDYPKLVTYNQDYNVSFLLKKSSFSNPREITIGLHHDKYFKEWTLEGIADDKNILINLNSRDLGIGLNKFDITISFFDKNNREYSSNREFSLELSNVKFHQRILILLNDIGRWLDGLFK
jgi:hypothetical protein